MKIGVMGLKGQDRQQPPETGKERASSRAFRESMVLHVRLPASRTEKQYVYCFKPSIYLSRHPLESHTILIVGEVLSAYLHGESPQMGGVLLLSAPQTSSEK